MSDEHEHEHDHEHEHAEAGEQELLRVVLGGDELIIELSNIPAEEPGVWGQIFASVAQKVAEAMAEEGDMPKAEALTAIRETFLRELEAGE